jgi:hypothetical protein
MSKRSLLFLLLASMAMPGYAQVFGALANFDVVNDTGKTAHGFEIELHDIHKTDITSIFGDATRWPNMERYGAPTVTEFTDNIGLGYGVKITYKATNNGTSWTVGTPSGTLPVSPSDSCWPLGAPTYGPLYPCDHFGVSTAVNTPNVKYSWLVEDVNPNNLVPVLASVPNPVWTVTPVAPIANVPQPPQVNVVVVAPAPINNFEFGEPRWVKVTATGTLQDVAVEDLVAENAIIKKANTQVQMEWQLLQTDTGNPAAGQIDLTGVALDPGATGVVYRFEFYKYTGNRDPQTNEALVGPNGDTPGIIGPSVGDLGAFIVAQNAGINFDGVIPAAPPLPIAPTLNTTINDATVGSPYSQVISATPGNANDTLTFGATGLPAGLAVSGNTISGTPTAVGTFPLTITVTDQVNGMSTTGTTQIQVVDSVIVFPSPLTLNQGTVNVAYSQKLSVTGGYGAIKYTITPALPAGLVLTNDTISGSPTTAGSTSLTVQATDSLNFSQVAATTLTIVNQVQQPPVACSGANKVISSVGSPVLYIAGGVANGGQSVNFANAVKTFTAPATTVLSGELVTYSGTLDNNSICVATTMTIAPGLGLTPSSLPIGTVGSAYPSTAVTPTGGVGPYTVSVSGLPAGMTFNGTSISGTPLLGANGTTTISISANDAVGETVHVSLSLTINAPAAIAPTASLPATGTVGTGYSGSFSPTGGVGALTLSVTGLPPGLSMSAGGTISGTPTTAGAYTVVLTAKDSIGQTVTVNKTLTIGDFTVAATTASLIVKRGSSITDSVTIAALSSFNGTVGLTVSGLPTNVTAIFSATSIANGAGSSTLTVKAASSAKTGTYTLTVKATSGALSHTKTISLSVK